jgi:hypothetical protein
MQEAFMPYSLGALHAFLARASPTDRRADLLAGDRAVSTERATSLASAAWDYCAEAAGNSPPRYPVSAELCAACLPDGQAPTPIPHASAAAIACTAALSTNRERRGDDHAYICVQTYFHRRVYHLSLSKHSRHAQEDAVTHAVLYCAAECLGISVPPFDEDRRRSGATLELSSVKLAVVADTILAPAAAIVSVAEGKVPAALGTATDAYSFRTQHLALPQLVCAGSFDPCHCGHLAMAAAARVAPTATARPLLFELCVRNADKPPLAYPAIFRRVALFARLGLPLSVTAAGTFSAKAFIFPPGSAFIVGIDTASRLLEAKFYGPTHDATALRAAFQTLKDRGVSFLVAGRAAGPAWVPAESILPAVASALGPSLAAMFKPLPAVRVDLSSSELRAADAAASEQSAEALES